MRVLAFPLVLAAVLAVLQVNYVVANDADAEADAKLQVEHRAAKPEPFLDRLASALFGSSKKSDKPPVKKQIRPVYGAPPKPSYNAPKPQYNAPKPSYQGPQVSQCKNCSFLLSFATLISHSFAEPSQTSLQCPQAPDNSPSAGLAQLPDPGSGCQAPEQRLRQQAQCVQQLPQLLQWRRQYQRTQQCSR